MTRLLITGASGLLGANLVLETEDCFEVTAVVHKQSMKFSRARVVQADLEDTRVIRRLFADTRPEWIIHCAADTDIESLEEDPQRASRLNTAMSREVAKQAFSVNAKLLFVSTDSVFDGHNGPYKESDETAPLNVYARSKLDGEYVLEEVCPGVLIVRTNIFGWSPGQKKSLAEWLHSKLLKEERCSGFSDIYFSPVYAPDLASIFTQMLEKGLEGTYHVPGDECISKYEFGRRLAVKFGFDPELIINTSSAQMHWIAERPKRTCLDGTKLTATLGIGLPELQRGLVRFREDYERGLFEGMPPKQKMEVLDA